VLTVFDETAPKLKPRPAALDGFLLRIPADAIHPILFDVVLEEGVGEATWDPAS
jgi:hypothetical protein